ncbi:MAG: hypothetical protein ABIJ18_01635 [archaeon]
MEPVTILGIIGLGFLLVAWTAELIDLIKKKKGKLDTNFAVFYIIGSVLLLVYSIQIKNLIFVILKIIVIILTVISLYYSLKLKKKKR